MALHAGLSYEKKLGGIMGLSGFYFTNTEVTTVNQDLPIFLSHGTIDSMIPWLAAQ
jgi:predicted esterase